MLNNNVNIIADIGGTNMRVAIAGEHGDISAIEIYACADYAGLAEVLNNFIEKHQLHNKDISACLAIACPVDKDLIVMTNLPWQFSQQVLKAQLQLLSLIHI